MTMLEAVVSLLMALGGLIVAGVEAGELPHARPDELGFSATRLDYIDRFYTEKVGRGEMAGIVTLIARHGKVVHFSAVGYADVEKKQKMRTDTIFRLYSMTKPIASTALMMLYEEGRFQMNDPLSKYIPEFSNLRVLRHPNGDLADTVPVDKAPTVQDVLRHTAGFSLGLSGDTYDSQYVKADVFGLDVSLAELMSNLSGIPLRYQPGTRFAYSVGPDIQARLVEILSGMPFDEFLEKRLFRPLDMQDAGFWVPVDKAKRLATVYWAKDGKLTPLDESHGHPERFRPISEPWSVNSYTVNHKNKGGNSGLVATAEDYWRYAQMMLNGGELNGVRILGPQVVRYMAQDHLGTIPVSPELKGRGFGLGFAVVKDSAASGYMSSEGTFYWSGGATTLFWIDPEEDLVVVAMTQHMGIPELDSFWAQIRTLVYSALME